MSFYLDRVSFTHKTHPHNKACFSKTKTCWKPIEGLSHTTKRKKESNIGRIAHFFVVIAFNKGIVKCKH